MKTNERINVAVKLLKEIHSYWKNGSDCVQFDIKVDKDYNGNKEIYVFPRDKKETAFYWTEYMTKIVSALNLSFYMTVSEGQVVARIYGLKDK